MDAVKVDAEQRIRLTQLNPGDYYVPEFHGTEEVLLHRVPPPSAKRTKAEILRALDASPLRFTAPWDVVKRETR